MSLIIRQLAKTIPTVAIQKKVGKKWVTWSRDVKDINCIEIMHKKSGLDPNTYMASHAGKLFKLTDKIPLQTAKVGDKVAHSVFSHTPRILIDGKICINQKLVEIYSKSARGHYDNPYDVVVYMKLSECNDLSTEPSSGEVFSIMLILSYIVLVIWIIVCAP